MISEFILLPFTLFKWLFSFAVWGSLIGLVYWAVKEKLDL